MQGWPCRMLGVDVSRVSIAVLIFSLLLALVLGEVTRVIQTCRDVRGPQVWKLLDNLVMRVSGRKVTENQGDRHARAVNTRLTAQHLRCAYDVATPTRLLGVSIHH